MVGPEIPFQLQRRELAPDEVRNQLHNTFFPWKEKTMQRVTEKKRSVLAQLDLFKNISQPPHHESIPLQICGYFESRAGPLRRMEQNQRVAAIQSTVAEAMLWSDASEGVKKVIQRLKEEGEKGISQTDEFAFETIRRIVADIEESELTSPLPHTERVSAFVSSGAEFFEEEYLTLAALLFPDKIP